MPSSRQTASFLKRRFEQVGIRPDTKHGQNFLIDMNLQELLIRAADVCRDDVVLEVGTGTGAIAARLAEKAAWVVTVEIDPRMYQLASEELVDAANVTMLHQDALKNKNTLAPRVLEEVALRLAEGDGRRFKMVSNLPYNIATPVLSNLLSVAVVPVSMTATIQKELAERIVAAPSTKPYGALGVWVQSLCFAHILRIMPPEVFWPRPKVESAIIQIIPDADRRAKIPDVAFFHQFVRSLFIHRRKFLRGVLLATYKRELGKAEIDRVMAELNLAGNSRAEELDVSQILELCEAVRRVL